MDPIVTPTWRVGQAVRAVAPKFCALPNGLTRDSVYTVVRVAETGVMVVADDLVERLYSLYWFEAPEALAGPCCPPAPAASAEDHDPVAAPSHYTRFAIEPITYSMANGLTFVEGNVIKYISRWRHKNGVEDLKKARRQIDFLIEQERCKEAGETFDPKKVP